MKTLNNEVDYITALAAAMKAGNKAGDSYNLNDWYPCGNSSVLIKPRTSKFAHWLLNMELVRNSENMKALVISSPDHYGQVMNARILYTQAFAKVFREQYNINCIVWSYID